MIIRGISSFLKAILLYIFKQQTTLCQPNIRFNKVYQCDEHPRKISTDLANFCAKFVMRVSEVLYGFNLILFFWKHYKYLSYINKIKDDTGIHKRDIWKVCELLLMLSSEQT